MADNFFSGDQARQPVQTVQNIVMTYLRGKLNDAEGPYQEILGADVTVTNSEELVSELYQSGASKQPWVEITLLKRESHFNLVSVGGDAVNGHRHCIEFLLDMSMSDHAAAEEGAERALGSDRKLIDAVTDVFDRGISDLEAMLIWDPDLQGQCENQVAATKRNPHVLSCFVLTQDG